MAAPASAVRLRVLGATERNDAWWVDPALTVAILGGFLVYATVRAVMNQHYAAGELLSPFYSPLIAVPDGWPRWLSPAMFILWAPAGFRFTCYYYRKAYYRAFAAHPPGCAVDELGHRYGGDYQGERGLLVFQNLHRYMLYFALILPVFLWHDAWLAFFPEGRFGITMGTIVLFANAFLLTGYTLSCHSLRHLVGGKLDCFSACTTNRIRHKAWLGLTLLNEDHMLWAWTSLFMVAFADLYVWMVASGRWINFQLL